MHVNRRNHPPEDDDFERRYWEAIHELNRKYPLPVIERHEPTPLKEYIIQTIELLKTDE
jgi:hypothetical protein